MLILEPQREQLTWCGPGFLKPEREAWHSQSCSVRSPWSELGPHTADL
jgi:hypothetical protein